MTSNPSNHARYGGPEMAIDGPKTALIQTLLSRRSCRDFSDRVIDHQTKHLLFAAAQSAPTKSNLQQYSLIEIADPSIRQSLQQLFPSVTWAISAPLLVVIVGDLHRTQQINAAKGHEFRWDAADAFLNASVDASLALGFMIAAAESLSLGSCPISTIRESTAAIIRLLELPKGTFPICACAFGYPTQKHTTLSPRLPQSVVVHQDRYQPVDMDAIHRYDQTLTEVMGEPKPRYPERYGMPRESTWSDNLARQTSVRERSDFQSSCEQQGLWRRDQMD